MPLYPASLNASTVYPPVLRPPKWVEATSIVSHMQTSHGWTRSGSGSSSGLSNLNDTTAANFIMGTQCATISTTGTNGAGNLANLDSPTVSVNLTASMLRILVKVDDITHMGLLNVFAGDAGLTNYWKWQIQAGPVSNANYVSSGDWVWLHLNIGDAVSTGSPTTSALAFIRLQIQDDNTSNPVAAHWQAVEVIPNCLGTFANGLVSICFDDTYQSVWDYGRAKMAQYDYRATLFTISDVVGGSQRLTAAELALLQDQLGWEVSAHAYTDVDHAAADTGMSSPVLDADARNQKAWLNSNGFRGQGHAYPLGQFGTTTDAVSTTSILRRYWAYCRTTLGKSTPSGLGLRETFPPADPFKLRAQSAITTFAGSTYAPSSLTTSTTGDLDKAKAQGQWIILVFHKIVTGTPAATTEIAQSDFNTIIDGINSRSMTVLPIGDALRYYG